MENCHSVNGFGTKYNMFRECKYKNWYFNIVASASNRQVRGYTETHHIIPKCLGGSNDPENLVVFTAREHFICHWLLTKMVDNKKEKYQLWNAFSCMLYRKTSSQDRYKVNSKNFQNIKQAGSKIKSERWTGENNPMYGIRGEMHHSFGKKQSPNHVAKLRETRIGRTRSEESRKKQSMTTKGKSQTQEHINKRKLFGSANGMFGKKLSPKTIAKREASRKANALAKKLSEGK